LALVLALDQGTTGSTALVVDEGGRILGRGYREIAQHFPGPGWVEHDPDEIWGATLAAAAEALGAARVSGRALSAIGITNQRETTVLWDRRSGAALHRAVVWQDRRTADRCRELDAALIAERTGLVPDPYFSATKVEWLLKRLRPPAAATAFGTVDSWLVHRLTRGRTHVTDPSNASRTMLYDIGAKRWDPELLAMFGVPPEILPEVRPSSGVFGMADAEWFGAEVSAFMPSWSGQPFIVSRQGQEDIRSHPDYFHLLPEPMRHASGHGGSAVFISAEFVNALLEDREPAIDVYESLAMTVPGLVAHQSALKDGEQLTVPQFDRGKA